VRTEIYLKGSESIHWFQWDMNLGLSAGISTSRKFPEVTGMVTHYHHSQKAGTGLARAFYLPSLQITMGYSF